MRSKIAIFLSVAVFLLFLNSCSNSKTAKVVLSEQENIKISNLGDASITLGSQTVSAQYVPSKAKTLSLTDPYGNVWELVIPQNALLTAQTITMQYISNIKQNVFSGNKISGVVLLPEGLHFINPAYLNVKGPAVSDKSCVIRGTSTGKTLNFSEALLAKDKITAVIEHFSSYYTYTPTSESEFKELAAKAEADYNATIEEVKAFLNTSISAPPIPPDFELSCENSENRPLDMYINRALMPEKDLIIKMIASGRNLANMGGSPAQSFEYEKKLMDRLVKKVDKLISSYKNDNKKIVPVMNLSFLVLKEANKLGMELSAQPYFEVFSGWMERAADEQIKKIKEEHYYSGLCKVLPLLYGRAVFEEDFKQSSELFEKYKQKLKDALSFTLTFEGEVTDVDSEGDRSVWKLSGKAPIEFDIEKLSDGVLLSGTGHSKYTDYTTSGKDKMKISASQEPIEVKAEIKGKSDQGYDLKINMDKISPDQLQYTDSDGQQYSFSSIKYIYANIFSANYNGVNIFFPVSLKNGQQEFTEPIRGALENASGTYEFTFKHTPK